MNRKTAKKPVRKTSAGTAAKKVAKKTPSRKPVKEISAQTARKIKPAKAAKPAKPAKAIKRVPPHIVRKPTAVAKAAPVAYVPVDTAKAVAFAMSIAQEMKRSAAKADKVREEGSVRLSRRPTTRTQGKVSVKFPASDLKDFRKRLMDARTKALNGVDAMRSTGFNEAEDHEADGGDGTNQTLRLQALGQMGNINRVIQQIDEALHRIDDGTYGVCASCGQLIRKPRLLNQPFVLTCMECQNEMERGSK